MSIFLGSQLVDVIGQIEQGAASASKQGGNVELGVASLPVLPKDATDRNRTSPFAFTGNKFEFRAVGSSAPIYWPQTVLNTAVADSLAGLADELEKLEDGRLRGPDEDPVRHRQGQQAGPLRGQRLLRGVARRGEEARPAEQPDDGRRAAGADDGEGEEAVQVASACCPSGSWPPASTSPGSATSRSRTSRRARALDIARTMILPAAARHLADLAAAGASGASRGIAAACDRVGGLIDSLADRIEALEHAQHEAHEAGTVEQEARAFVEGVIPAQNALREAADELETVVADDYWPLPKYRELLFQY